MKLDRELLRSLLVNPQLDHGGDDLIANCPYCGGREWGISLKDGHRFNCYRKSACGETGNIFKLLKKVGRLDLLRSRTPDIILSDRLENIIAKKLDTDLDLNTSTITPPMGFKRIYNHKYLEARGFSDYEKYKVGVTRLDSKLRNYIIFLIEEAGELKGYVARSTYTKEQTIEWNKTREKKLLRYNNSTSDFAKLLGGYDELTSNTKTVILVEGLFKKINIDKLLALDEQEEVKCCVTFGAKISEEQILKLQLKGVESIIIMFDPDVINKIKKHAIELMMEFETVRVALHHSKSPDDFNEEDALETLGTLQSPINFYVNKVQVLNLK